MYAWKVLYIKWNRTYAEIVHAWDEDSARYTAERLGLDIVEISRERVAA